MEGKLLLLYLLNLNLRNHKPRKSKTMEWEQLTPTEEAQDSALSKQGIRLRKETG